VHRDLGVTVEKDDDGIELNIFGEDDNRGEFYCSMDIYCNLLIGSNCLILIKQTKVYERLASVAFVIY